MQLSQIEFKKDGMVFPNHADMSDHYFSDVGIEIHIHAKEDEVDETMAVGVTAWQGKDKRASPSIHVSFTAEEFGAFAQSIYAINMTLQEQRRTKA